MALHYKTHVRRHLRTLYSLFPRSGVFGLRCQHIRPTTAPSESDVERSLASHNYQALVAEELRDLNDRIREALQPSSSELRSLTHYQFESGGKAIRPTLVTLISRTCNRAGGSSETTESQARVAMIAEMIHAASLVHDDLLDSSALRRGRASVQHAFGHRQAVLAGDYILSTASQILALINNPEVVVMLSRVIEDLVSGEVLQLGGSKDKDSERLNHYLRKTYQKTASLMANSCSAVCLLSPGVATDQARVHAQAAFEFGRNFGMMFQLTDDLLDVESSAADLGKPARGADLRLGLATGPVLFAAQDHPELRELIMRRFSNSGDVERALHLVQDSDGVEQTRRLSAVHAEEAARQLLKLPRCVERLGLRTLIHRVLHREK